MMEYVDKTKKTSSVLSWLGFSFAILVTVLLLVAFGLILSGPGRGDGVWIIFIPVMVFGILALIFSIKGLVSAARNHTPKWMSIAGLSLCVINSFIFLAPLFSFSTQPKEPVQVQMPAWEREEEPVKENCVCIQIYSRSRVRCIDYRKDDDNVVANIRTYEHDFQQQLKHWLKINNVDENAEIEIHASKDADYSDVKKVTDALQSAGLTKFTMKSDLKDYDYYD